MQGDGRAIHAGIWHRGDFSADRKAPHPYARTGNPRDGYTYFDYLSQVAGAADLARFDGLWIPHTDGGDEPLILAGAFAREARNLQLVPQLRAPFLSAVYAGKIANSFQRLSAGRLAWHLVYQPDQAQTWHGRHWSYAEQIERTGEFLDVAKGFWHAAPFTYQGKYYEVENGGFAPALQGVQFPLVYLSGTTPAEQALSARHADVHLLDLAPLDVLRDQIRQLNALAAAQGRRLRFGLTAEILARESTSAAWDVLRQRWEDARAVNPADDSAPFEALQTDPLIWSGFDQWRPGAAAGLVGGYAELITRFGEFAALGIDTFVLSANPAVEEAYRLSEKLLPFIRKHPVHIERQLAE